MKNNLLLSPTAPRAGLTLSEVLISVALLSLGIIGLAVLFPLSVLKSIQATQMTNATNLRYNAEAYLDLVSPSPLNTAPQDRPLTFPTRTTDPAMVLVVDPVGWLNTPSANNQRHYLGSDGVDQPVGNTRRIPGIAVFNSAAPTTWETDVIKQLGTLPDSWVNFYDGPGAVSATMTQGTYTFDTDADLGSLGTVNATDPEYRRPRIVLFNLDGRRAERRALVSVNTPPNSVTWDGPLPADFKVSRARIETPDPRYTWMMTVRKTVITPATTMPVAPAVYGNRIDVVVFFNRRFSPQDEQVYSGVGRTAFRMGDNTVVLDYSSTGVIPFVKNGGYIFDSANGYWYRIIRYADDTSNQKVTIYLDRLALAVSDSAILMRGIVDVYPIATRES